MVQDYDGKVIFTQLLSGVMNSGQDSSEGSQYIGPCSQILLCGRALVYLREFGQLLVVSSNSRIESYK